jgi:mono/diheme cytochrome c family protein
MKLLFCVFPLLLLAATPGAFAQDQKTGQSVTYRDIGPIFQSKCASCHSGPRAANGLHLDSYQGVMDGARAGKVLVPGNPQQSELVRRLTGTSKPQMPKNGPPFLPENQISLIEKWIAGGALE